MTSSSPTINHRQSSHCESGVMSTLISHLGLSISEPMAFGLSSCLSFAYLPFVKISGLPLIAYRMPPGWIIKHLSKIFKLGMKTERFRKVETAQQRLDQLLAEERLVGLQTSVYWLPYLPENLRFHFNAHNLIVYGKTDANYLISDPVAEHVVSCPISDLNRARFAKGALAPKGKLYYSTHQPSEPDWEKISFQAIEKTCKIMLQPFVPIAGVKGIRCLAKQIAKLKTHDQHKANAQLYIGHIIRMQEEIGTGGGGFRFMYAAFLQELAHKLNQPILKEFSQQLIDIGDEWREFALLAAYMARDRKPLDTLQLSQKLMHLADLEYTFFKALRQTIRVKK